MPDTARMRVLRGLTAAYSSVDQEKKYYFAKQYKALAEKMKIDTLVAEAYIDMGGSHGIRSQMDSALFYFQKGYEKSKQLNYQGGIARSLASIGFTYDKLDNETQAIEKYNEALAIYKRIGNKKGINQCLVNMGGIYFDVTEYERAESYFLQAYESNVQINNEQGIANTLFSLGNVNKRLGNREKSLDYYKQSLKIAEKLGDINAMALANWGIGTIKIEKEQYKEALVNLEIALQHDIDLKNKYHASAVLMSIATAHLGLNDYKKAYAKANEAYENSFLIDSKNARMEALKVLTNISKQQHKFENAFNYQTHYWALYDSVEKDMVSKKAMISDFKRVETENAGLVKNNKVIKTKNSEYLVAIGVTSALLLLVVVLLFLFYSRYKEKQATNKLLQQQKEEIAAINTELEALNEEVTTQMEITTSQNLELAQLNSVKNKFFSIVSHDLRNPLANLKMLFSMYREGQLDEQELNELLAKLEETIYTTAAFLDNLLEWSKSQLDGIVVKPSVFLLEDTIAKNIAMVSNQIKTKGLLFENNITKNTTVFADPNMVDVIVRNLISNCIKFCMPGDSVTIDAEESEGQILLLIKDTGPGMTESNLKNLFSLEHTVSMGTSGEKGHHIGLILCRDMAEQNNGSIHVESEVGKGTVFFITLPSGNK